MLLTPTTHIFAFSRPSPDAATFAFPPASSYTSPSSTTASDSATPNNLTTITFHAYSTLSTQLHWHTTHTEYIRVLNGATLATISGKSKICVAEDGDMEVPRHARHEWMRFDRPSNLLSAEQRKAQETWIQSRSDEEVQKLRETDLIVEEWTLPSDGQKEVFFRNLFSTFREPQYKSSGFGGVLAYLQVICVMWELDNYPVFIDMNGADGTGWGATAEYVVAYTVMGVSAMMGWLVGCKAVNEEYTPEYLLKRNAERAEKGE
ncbi:hypothetical protein MMC28_007649 [Mycoblastus sanguinarius]|nr:hypothetical protein [Mycoblastus sanguinarius]